MKTSTAIVMASITMLFGCYVGWHLRDAAVSTQAARSDPVATSPSSLSAGGGPALKIEEIETKPTEANDVWVRCAWRLTVSNSSDIAQTFSARIEWQDKDGFVIADQRQYNLEVDASSKRTFTGYELVEQPGAQRIEKVVAKLEP